MTNYEVKFENNGVMSTVSVNAEDKSNAIEKAWDLFGFMIVIKEISESGN